MTTIEQLTQMINQYVAIGNMVADSGYGKYGPGLAVTDHCFRQAKQLITMAEEIGLIGPDFWNQYAWLFNH